MTSVTSTNLTPREIVTELDRHIIGQAEAKRAVAIALRNRWRRLQLDSVLQEETLPRNILMIGPTGVGKTEIARRLAKLAEAPFIKVEATKFTEIGYVGRDVEQIIRDLVEIAIHQVRKRMREDVRSMAEAAAEERVLDALAGSEANPTTREQMRRMLHDNLLEDREVEIEVRDTASSGMPTFDVPGMPGAQMGMLNISDMFGKAFGKTPTKKRRVSVSASYDILLAEESDKLLDDDIIIEDAIYAVQNNGIVFLDEIDKIARSTDRSSGDVSREGVQRDLLPLIEGATVSTKHGVIQTEHILFIASGAFHTSKPSDLLPELQGRLPIRVELEALSTANLRQILTEPESSILTQTKALMAAENVTLNFTEEALDALAEIAADANSNIENIGARRLHTILEKVVEDISFEAPEKAGENITLDAKDVRECLEGIVQKADVAKFIL